MIGIYKITSPSGKVYIGQSIDIERRFNTYKNMKGFKSQIRLFNSFVKYGTDNHNFEIIQECDEGELNIWERYWQDVFNVLGKSGLNCVLQSASGKPYKITEKVKVKLSNNQKGSKNSFYGKKHTAENLEKFKERMSGNIPTNSKLVLSLSTGIFYNSCAEASRVYCIKRTTLGYMLRGVTPNKTDLIYV